VSLTASQRRVLELRAEGLTIKAVAGRMGISDQTVKNHITGAYDALEVDNIVGAMTRLGWVRLPGVEPARCAFVGQCGRPAAHRGHHGGFRATT
jgi:DNA-binding CsgD family transcriptional regulator